MSVLYTTLSYTHNIVLYAHTRTHPSPLLTAVSPAVDTRVRNNMIYNMYNIIYVYTVYYLIYYIRPPRSLLLLSISLAGQYYNVMSPKS